MKTINRLQECAIKTLIILAIASFNLVQSCTVQAQTMSKTTRQSAIDYTNPMKNAHKKINHPENINLTATATVLRSAINSGFDDIKPRLTPCGNRLYFSRTFHPGNTNGVMDSEDIWYADFNTESNAWSEPIHMAGVLNNHGPNYVNNVSATGDTIILGNQYGRRGKMTAGLSYSVNVNGQWSVPTNIVIENDYNMSEHANAFVSLKNGVIIRSIQRAESLGERDLFVSFWDGETATEPLNMGNVINTEFEESSPYLASDNKTLYFASKGHDGYGNFDIFVTRRLDDSWTNWTQPENLGPAVNGPMDDEFFSITHCGKFAVFSKQVNVHNTDLFRISLEELFGTSEVKVNEKENEKSDLKNSAVASL
jgi:OOP family OmpA-OmpF porin